ncbi:hypothetical protein PENSPDRAFT_227174 [Peniophora sp. CONT]|nr:hypothetical protein PENSPDRAFT_227174 [Peniophora sp. CONT]
MDALPPISMWSKLGDAMKLVALAHAEHLEERLAHGVHVSPAKWLTVIHVCQSWRSDLLACPYFWLRVPADISAAFLRLSLPHTPSELVFQVVQHLSTSEYLRIEAHVLPDSMVPPKFLITHLTISGLGTSDVVALVAYLAEHLQHLSIETSTHVDGMLGSRHHEVDPVPLVSLPSLKTISIVTDCSTSLAALTKLLRPAINAEKRIFWSKVRGPGSVDLFFRAVLNDRALGFSTLYLDAESPTHLRVKVYPGTEPAMSPTGVPSPPQDTCQAFFDLWMEWDYKIPARNRTMLCNVACAAIADVLPSTRNVTLAFGPSAKPAGPSIDLHSAMNGFAHAAPLETLILRGDSELAIQNIATSSIPIARYLVVEDNERIRSPSELREAVALFNPVVDELQLLNITPKVFVGGCGLFSDRCRWSKVIWDILIPEELMDDWSGSTIVDLDPLPEHLQLQVDQACDEWYEEHYKVGLGGPESLEPNEQPLIELVLRLKASQNNCN